MMERPGIGNLIKGYVVTKEYMRVVVEANKKLVRIYTIKEAFIGEGPRAKIDTMVVVYKNIMRTAGIRDVTQLTSDGRLLDQD